MKNNEIIGNTNYQSADDFYISFKQKLEEAHIFPCDYMYKCIVPAEEKTLAQVYAVFGDACSDLSTRDSKNGNYTSVTAKVKVHDADDVILYYRQLSAIKGVVML